MSGTARASGRGGLTFWRMLRRSLAHRRARSLSALVALTVSAAVATALLTLYSSLDMKLHREFRSFGANVVVTAPASTGLPADSVERVREAAGADAVAVPFGYAVATTDRGTSVVVAGTEFEGLRRLNPTWQVDHWPANVSAVPEALLGARAAQFVADENDLRLTFNGKVLAAHTVGHVRTGAEEDSRIYVPLASFSTWTGQPATVLEIQVPGGAARIDRAMAALRRAFPGAQVAPIRQLVEGESRIVDRTHALMYASVLLIALTVGLSVLATLSASILERRRDFALMKALGGSQGHLLGLFLIEAVVLALAGVVAGWLIGSGLAAAISELNFHTATLPEAQVIPAILLLNVAIAAAAALIPARVLRGLEPAALLKGD